MGSTERRYAKRHPVMWAAHYWPHWVMAVSLVVIGFAVSARVFEVTVGAAVWPGVMVATAALVIASAFRPLLGGLQVATAATILGVSVFRVLVYMQALVDPDVPDSIHPIVWTLIAHWVITGAVGILWPKLSELCGARATVAAGRDVLPLVRGQE